MMKILYNKYMDTFIKAMLIIGIILVVGGVTSHIVNLKTTMNNSFKEITIRNKKADSIISVMDSTLKENNMMLKKLTK